MARSVPEHLTLVDATNANDVRTLVVDDEMGNLLVAATNGPQKITVTLTEAQAKQLRGRIDKFFRDNR